MTKDEVLKALGDYIADLSNLKPVPLALIEDLSSAEGRIFTANAAEFAAEGWEGWWLALAEAAGRA